MLVGDGVVRDVLHHAVQVLRRGPVEPVVVHGTDLDLGAGAAEVGEGVVLVRDHPAARLLAQPEGEPQPQPGVSGELVLRAASHEGVGEGDVLARGDLQLLDVEGRPLSLPREEGRPDRPVGVGPAHAPVGRRHVEHHDVLGVIRDDRVDTTLMHGFGPALDERSDLLGVFPHGSSVLSVSVCMCREGPASVVKPLPQETSKLMAIARHAAAGHGARTHAELSPISLR